ncbi:peptide-n4-(n-acetyl-beta-glucosaminyl)asparagine amidase a [Phlyctema vagabunda]|uniref:Peptide-n4-(N-acetyl-beta-glucosaminyl)asparagine amidase a n=1 Tax=Phlyctema vagabunda TaxID=108571 RepID=A0ABR4PBH1_9HELO
MDEKKQSVDVAESVSKLETWSSWLRSIVALGGISVLIFLVHQCRWEPESLDGPSLQPRQNLAPRGLGPVVAKQNNNVAIRSTPATTSASPTSTGVLDVFQVYPPILVPGNNAPNTTLPSNGTGTPNCEVLLMEYSFGNSYGAPFVGSYTPPGCSFNRVVMNFTVTSRGRQFDRLALMYFGDTEVFRTSTAEPTVAGIKWTYMKDMSEYLYFWNAPQKIIFDLGNIIDSTYTGFFNTTLTATFFTSQEVPEPAALIVPISARQGASNGASVFMVPTVNATNTVTLPRNINRAVFTVSACGQASEEFWWSNVFQSDTLTFDATAGAYGGYSAFREVQLYIDGQLAGVHWPFPIIFTGGVVPGLWRPIVGIDAFDLREHEIDITPWLAILCDGAPHTFEIRVAGVIDDGGENGVLIDAVGNSWYVTGKIFLWLDSDETSITTGQAPSVLLPEPVITLSQSLTQNSTGFNETLINDITVTRSLSVSASIITQNGTQRSAWTQSLSYSNFGQLSDFGYVQLNDQSTIGNDQSKGNKAYKSSYSYPLWANTSIYYEANGAFTLGATLQRGLSLQTEGASVFPSGVQDFDFSSVASPGPAVGALFSGTSLVTAQNGTATYFGSPTTNSSTSGTTGQTFSFSGIDTQGGVGNRELYTRDVLAVNGTVVRDQESLVGAPISSPEGSSPAQDRAALRGVAPSDAKALIGHGLGQERQSLVSVSVGAGVGVDVDVDSGMGSAEDL